MDHLELLKQRRSVKKYLPKMVDEESIKKLLRPVAVISVVAVCFLRLIAERSESESSNRGYLSQVASRPTRI